MCDYIQICTFAVSDISLYPTALHWDKVVYQHILFLLSQRGKEEEERALGAGRTAGFGVYINNHISWPGRFKIHSLTAPALELAASARFCNRANSQLCGDDRRSVCSLPKKSNIF